MTIVSAEAPTVRRVPAPACVGKPFDLFFKPEHTKAALATCAACPVRVRCLREELQRPQSQQYGVRGGMTAHRRRTFLRDLRRIDYALPASAQLADRTTTHPTLAVVA